VLRHKAVELLARREHSQFELVRKLRVRKFDPEAIAQLIKQLVESDLLSDLRFAHALVHSRTERGYGPIRIRATLRERGVDDDVIAQALDPNDPQWVERARVRVRRRFGDEAPVDLRDEARRSRYLAGQGYSHEQVRALKRGSHL
jgi:regulatory protein